MKRITGGIVVALLLVAMLVAALGVVDAADAAKRKKVQTKTLRADPDGGLTFNKRKIHAKAGRVKLVMHNPKGTGTPHGIAVEGNGVDKDGKIVNPGKTSRLTVKLAPGTYEFYCPFDGHKAAGMKGKLVVR